MSAVNYSIHLSTAKGWRGGENQIWLLARGLKARGHKTLVLAPEGEPLLDRCNEAGIPCRGFRIRGELDLIGVLRLAALIKREKPDILHVHDGHAVMPGQIAARFISRKKLKLVVHRRTVFRLRGKWKYRGRADRVVAISEAVKDNLTNAGIPAESIRVVHSGLEFPDALPRESPEVVEWMCANGIPPDAFVIGHAAALTGEKRQAEIIDAVAGANEQASAGGGQIHLVLAGKGDLEETLRRRAAARGQERTVHFLGFQRDLRPLWAASHMALFASEAEGLCTALVEAQGAGLPAVITRAGGMSEVVAEGETGLSVAIGDVEAMAAAIVRLRNDAALRLRMSGAARNRARSRFSADAMVDGILKVYEDLLAPGR